MKDKEQIIYLVALMHDIGKFYQRADINRASKSTILSQKIKNLEGNISPKHYKTQLYTHKHVLWTAQFFENFESSFNRYINFDSDDWSYDKLLRLSAAHHSPVKDNLLECIIQKADHYSSGIDRDKNEGMGWKDAAEELDNNWDAFKRTRMRSVFEGVSLTNEWPEMNAYKKELPLREINLDESFFPVEIGSEESETDYQKLWNNFENELKLFQNRTLYSFNESLLYLLEKYTSRIPSSTQHLPDVSLYDHLKTTAAFASSLYYYIQDKNLKKLPTIEEKPFALIGGTLSGVQKFIFNIAAKGAAKNLKGRSFYLQLLADNVLQLLLDKLKLQSGNIVYSSGGGFYIIAANTNNLQKELKLFEDSLIEKLFNFHGIELYLTVDFEPFGEQEIFNQEIGNQNIGAIWKKLAEKLSLKKGRRFGTLIKNKFGVFFEPQKVNPENLKDTITGEELEKDFKYLDENKEQPVNRYTYKQIELGKILKKADYWILSKQKLTYFPEDVFCFEAADLGLFNYFIDEKILNEYNNKLRTSADDVRVIQFNKKNFLEPLQKGINNVYGFSWYGGNDYPVNGFGNPKTFEELAGISYDTPNIREDAKRISGSELTRLGVLRMDVDNLGSIFRRGLAPGRLSFSRYSTLSRSLDWFFKGYLNTIWKNSEDYKNYTQIIYSGGDDLFLVGKWDILICMAGEIQEAFKKWVCENPQLTISGGMASVAPRFPILKSAAYSEVFEKAAKKHNCGSIEKNSFAFTSYTPHHLTGELIVSLNWDTEYLYLKKLKEDISELMGIGDGRGLSEGFSNAIYDLLQQAKMEKNKGGRYYPSNLRVVWLAAYQFRRSSDGKVDEVKSFLKDWSNNIMTGRILGESLLENTNYHSLQLLAIAARWVALEDRSKIKKVN